ncbi:MAG: AraC family transcriptional regulator [Prevotella sp.]|nr:AraC family transcriptional regulator [Prevotella sp.]
MYTLKETWHQNYSHEPVSGWDGKMICIALDAEMSFRSNETEGHSLHYSFTIVTQGWLTFVYNGQEITLRPNDLYIYSPGMAITILSASSDYHSVCILIDEQSALEIPTVRHLVSIAYQPLALLNGPVVSLPPEAAGKLVDRISEMIAYFNSRHIYKSQVLQQLFSVFILDVQNMMEIATDHQQPPLRMEEIFIVFLRLLSEYFADHHDIAFYAGRLHITTTYLSRIVKRLTGRTVGDYINQLLAMEAAFLLTTTSYTVSQIADRLHFADTASFSKFFLRMKGQNPRDFRKDNYTLVNAG